jgi:hypothetical protein
VKLRLSEKSGVQSREMSDVLAILNIRHIYTYMFLDTKCIHTDLVKIFTEDVRRKTVKIHSELQSTRKNA